MGPLRRLRLLRGGGADDDDGAAAPFREPLEPLDIGNSVVAPSDNPPPPPERLNMIIIDESVCVWSIAV